MLKGKGLPRRGEHNLISEESEIVNQLLGVHLTGHNNKQGGLKSLEETRQRECPSAGRDRPNRAQIGERR
jgi:hypothetical protein